MPIWDFHFSLFTNTQKGRWKEKGACSSLVNCEKLTVISWTNSWVFASSSRWYTFLPLDSFLFLSLCLVPSIVLSSSLQISKGYSDWFWNPSKRRWLLCFFMLMLLTFWNFHSKCMVSFQQKRFNVSFMLREIVMKQYYELVSIIMLNKYSSHLNIQTFINCANFAQLIPSLSHFHSNNSIHTMSSVSISCSSWSRHWWTCTEGYYSS